MACDFIGQLLSDKATLDNFCEAIRSGEVQRETARGFMAVVRKILGKLRGKGVKQFDAVTKQLAEKAAKQFGTELETAENAVKAMQQVLSEAARAEKNTTQEGDVRKYALKSYSEKQLQNWKDSKRIVIYKDKQQFERLLQDAISGKNSTWKMYFGSIPKALADRILSDTGIDVENYNVSLTAYEAIKILNGHGNEEKEALRGQRAIIIDDYLAIPLIIEQPTSIKRSSKDYMGKPVIEFVRRSGDTRYKLAAVVSNKHLDFFVQTMYAWKKRNLPTPTDDQASVNTPEANNGTVSNNRIPQTTTESQPPKVRKSLKNTKKDSDRSETTAYSERYGSEMQTAVSKEELEQRQAELEQRKHHVDEVDASLIKIFASASAFFNDIRSLGNG